VDASVLYFLISWLLAAVFAVAAWHKVSAWPRFKASLAAYRLLPGAAVAVVGAGLAMAELVAVILLCLSATQQVGLMMAMGLLSVYAGAIGVSVMRGRTEIDCGCGDEPTPVSMTLVFRNVLLIALAGFAMSEPAAAIAWPVALVAGGLTLVAYGLYSSIEQLIANRARHRRLWLGAS